MDTTTAVLNNRIIRAVFQILTITLFLFASVARANSAATASLYKIDTSTEGNWQGVYGADGSALEGFNSTIPAYATFSVQNQMNWTWAASTTNPRALQTSTGRAATTWYSPSSFSFSVNFTDGATHPFEMYALDWDSQGRSETVQVLDANSGAILSSQTISSFVNGTYLAFNISGNVKINITTNSGPNAVISGVFFGGASASASTAPVQPAATAAFVRADVSTQGDWPSAYGSDGYSLATATQSLPSYATFAVSNNLNWTWAASTTDPRALQTTSGRLAATWYSGSNFSFNVNFTDGNAHTFSMYALDWDKQGRSETVQILDANSGLTLNTQNISGFSGGMYLVYTVSGHVKINVISTAGPNAVISGVFFGTLASTPPVTTPVTTTTPPPAPALTYLLSSNVSSLNFGTVTVSQDASQVVTLTNGGTGNITISNVSVAGAGFNVSGISTGTVLKPGQSASLTATFTPASAGSLSGSIVVSSNATTSAIAITLTGTGAAQQHSVALAWTASTSSSIVGYNTYFSAVSGGPYAKLNSTPVASTGYTDSTVTAGMTRYYVVTSVNSGSEESGYSTEVGVTIP